MEFRRWLLRGALLGVMAASGLSAQPIVFSEPAPGGAGSEATSRPAGDPSPRSARYRARREEAYRDSATASETRRPGGPGLAALLEEPQVTASPAPSPQVAAGPPEPLRPELSPNPSRPEEPRQGKREKLAEQKSPAGKVQKLAEQKARAAKQKKLTEQKARAAKQKKLAEQKARAAKQKKLAE
ncbi:MAG: hypothetical protein CL910_18915, partial [Deltaproteobacteria bacterium]|nr:hypothetical protein [Deltaproteobacteria bacterium]